jgi:hypothetical protein
MARIYAIDKHKYKLVDGKGRYLKYLGKNPESYCLLLRYF